MVLLPFSATKQLKGLLILYTRSTHQTSEQLPSLSLCLCQQMLSWEGWLCQKVYNLAFTTSNGTQPHQDFCGSCRKCQTLVHVLSCPFPVLSRCLSDRIHNLMIILHNVCYINYRIHTSHKQCLATCPLHFLPGSGKRNYLALLTLVNSFSFDTVPLGFARHLCRCWSIECW